MTTSGIAITEVALALAMVFFSLIFLTMTYIFVTYMEINRYSRISFTWASPVANNLQMILDFREISQNRTELTLSHTLFLSEEVRTANNTGWEVCFDYLETRIISPAELA